MATKIERKIPFLFLALLITVFLSSCTRTLGYGVLLWSAEDPPVPSGTVLPVYIRSNIDHVWVVGIPKEFRVEGSKVDKFEIPLPKLELAGSRRRAQERAEEFAPWALSYAETLQDGLPIRENPDNGARRVYRLKLGEIVKILSPVEGVEAVGASGDPLPGEWFRVLTENGTTGFCFSYRLKLFEHSGGVLAAVMSDQQDVDDPDLDRLLARRWSPESYGTMLNTRRYDLEELSYRWSFDPGQDTGIARINVRDLDLSFQYTTIRSTGTQSWRFEGTELQMNLRSENTLAVQFTESNGLLRTFVFVALPTAVEDIILQESSRREDLFQSIYEQGPLYVSSNYGTLRFREGGRFTWTGNMLLVPQVIPASALGTGSIDMRLFLADNISSLYSGAFTLRFDGVGGAGAQADFMYSLDSQGFRIEYVPQTSLDGNTVVRRATSPLVLYFYRSSLPEEAPPVPGIWDFFPPPDIFDPWAPSIPDEAQGIPPEINY
jgi:hypothetical protein